MLLLCYIVCVFFPVMGFVESKEIQISREFFRLCARRQSLQCELHQLRRYGNEGVKIIEAQIASLNETIGRRWNSLKECSPSFREMLRKEIEKEYPSLVKEVTCLREELKEKTQHFDDEIQALKNRMKEIELNGSSTVINAAHCQVGNQNTISTE